MEGIRELLEAARTNGLVPGRFRGLLHVAIGRTVTKPDGTKISAGITWRAVAQLLKAMRFDQEFAREVGADPATLSPRDRERFWYAVIALARPDSAEAVAEAEKLIAPLKALGYIVAPPPGGSAPPPAKPKPKAPTPPPKEDPKKKKK